MSIFVIKCSFALSFPTTKNFAHIKILQILRFSSDEISCLILHQVVLKNSGIFDLLRVIPSENGGQKCVIRERILYSDKYVDIVRKI